VDLLEAADLGVGAVAADRDRPGAAVAPVIVVTQGIPWRTAALRIS